MRPGLLISALLAAAAGLTAVPAAAQPAEGAPAAAEQARPLEAAEQRLVLAKLARELEARFVFPETGARYAAMLRRNLADGAYKGLTDPVAFGQKVTADLQAIAPDRHLRFAPEESFRRIVRQVGAAPGKAPEALEETKMIGDVAYLRFNLFPDDPAVAARAREFLLAHADAKAVIVDCRANRGGSLTVMDAILPLLFAKKQTLVRMDTRAEAARDEYAEETATLVLRPGPAAFVRQDHVVTPDAGEKRLQRVPVYYLTSRRTGSAAEHLALAFKHTGRATVIGEPTYGAGHYGGVLPIGERFAAFIPVGRTYDPSTGKDWEAVGVEPDVAVPADQALDEALRRAAVAARN